MTSRAETITAPETPVSGKNIIILSDGTGQRGGLGLDEHRTNIYKIYRAVRCGPDCSVDPRSQLAFYDPGLGTSTVRLGGSIPWLYRKALNTASQATGLGIIGNMIDCYASIIRMYEPGDRIFVLGFSRGAYTVRCLSGVLALCGVPTQMPDGSPLKRDLATSRKIAKEAVKGVYAYTHSRERTPDGKLVPGQTTKAMTDEAKRRQEELLAQRDILAAQFRLKYGSDRAGESNVCPHFIGVFDTVASLMNPASMIVLVTMGAIAAALLSGLLSWLTGLSYWLSLAGLCGAGAAAASLYAIFAPIRWAKNLPGHPLWRTLHRNRLRVQMYDNTLHPGVNFARHAIAIDETRKSFQRVTWGRLDHWPPGKPKWLDQKWFAGIHSDVGGGYPENESRLSDIALQWMVEEAAKAGMQYDPSFLRTYPCALGMQHDETKRGLFRFGQREDRKLVPGAPLHSSVFDRLKAKGVLHDDEMKEYRPSPLRHHEIASKLVEFPQS